MSREYVSDRSFDVVRKINSNDRKGTKALIVRDAQNAYFFKHSTGPVSSPFHRELEFYRVHSGAQYLPPVVEVGADYILLEELSAMTLREALITGSEIPFDTIVAHLRAIYGPPLRRRPSSFSEAFRLLGLCSNLVNSAPDDARRDASSWRRLRFLMIAPLMVLKYWLMCLRTPMRSYAYAHGDLHLNNVLIVGGYAYIVDWENSGSTSVAGDLAYFFSMLLNLSDTSEVREAFEAVIADYDPRIQRLCREVLQSYLRAVKSNPSFSSA
jgi:hypothetical protein